MTEKTFESILKNIEKFLLAPATKYVVDNRMIHISTYDTLIIRGAGIKHQYIHKTDELYPLKVDIYIPFEAIKRIKAGTGNLAITNAGIQYGGVILKSNTDAESSFNELFITHELTGETNSINSNTLINHARIVNKNGNALLTATMIDYQYGWIVSTDTRRLLLTNIERSEFGQWYLPMHLSNALPIKTDIIYGNTKTDDVKYFKYQMNQGLVELYVFCPEQCYPDIDSVIPNRNDYKEYKVNTSVFISAIDSGKNINKEHCITLTFNESYLSIHSKNDIEDIDYNNSINIIPDNHRQYEKKIKVNAIYLLDYLRMLPKKSMVVLSINKKNLTPILLAASDYPSSYLLMPIR